MVVGGKNQNRLKPLNPLRPAFASHRDDVLKRRELRRTERPNTCMMILIVKRKTSIMRLKTATRRFRVQKKKQLVTKHHNEELKIRLVIKHHNEKLATKHHNEGLKIRLAIKHHNERLVSKHHNERLATKHHNESLKPRLSSKPRSRASNKENDRKRADERRAASIFSAAELEDLGLDDAPFPDAIPMDFVQGLVKKAQDLLHGDHRICAVCDELNLHSGDFADYDVSELPSKMFDVLAPPDGSLVTCPALDPILREQYNVGDFFSSDKDKLGSLLLSQRAFRRQCHLHALPVVDASDPDYVQPRVPMCGRCWRSLNTKPKSSSLRLSQLRMGFFTIQ